MLLREAELELGRDEQSDDEYVGDRDRSMNCRWAALSLTHTSRAAELRAGLE